MSSLGTRLVLYCISWNSVWEVLEMPLDVVTAN